MRRLRLLPPGAGTPAEGAPSSAAVPGRPSTRFKVPGGARGPPADCPGLRHPHCPRRASSSCSLPAGSPAGASAFPPSRAVHLPLLRGVGANGSGVGMGWVGEKARRRHGAGWRAAHGTEARVWTACDGGETDMEGIRQEGTQAGQSGKRFGKTERREEGINQHRLLHSGSTGGNHQEAPFLGPGCLSPHPSTSFPCLLPPQLSLDPV